ncbi:hypothetical protein B0T26DRAFT_757452 [Lasiosphaeria miniovina]|uniref:Protein kinase domain-containing protein n=1 Tax=Lasiosphaeria miniovina TaxID=1954250 RepID=A0AA40DJS5_9PEZI|nr:uncharacterized protein B0T26DRAFT_757452 [Lasiosphaeria miniovina]KAK0703956.1 hypothetical protein B0T26DRAFT_757452 [Lasiosphaeria miniovina]
MKVIVEIHWQQPRFIPWCHAAGLVRIGGLEDQALKPQLQIPDILRGVTEYHAILHSRLDSIGKFLTRYDKPGKDGDGLSLVPASTNPFQQFNILLRPAKTAEVLADAKTQISELHNIIAGNDSDILRRLLMANATASQAPSPLKEIVNATVNKDGSTNVAVNIGKIRNSPTPQNDDSFVRILSAWVLDTDRFDLTSDPFHQVTRSRGTGTASLKDGLPRTIHVLVELKRYSPAFVEKALFRAFDLCRLLGKSSEDQGFHTTSALGIIRERDRDRLGIVYLHKSFRSDNILTFCKDSTDLGSHKFVITGFDLSRPDVTDEFSERPQSELGNDLYRHPEDIRNAEAEGLYRKEYDIYGLGVVLIEVALWKPVLSLLRGGSEMPEEFYTRLRSPILDEDEAEENCPPKQDSRFLQNVERERAVERWVKIDANDRFATIDEIDEAQKASQKPPKKRSKKTKSRPAHLVQEAEEIIARGLEQYRAIDED